MTFYLLQGIQHYANQNQQRGTTKEVRKLGIDSHHVGKCRQNGNDSQNIEPGKVMRDIMVSIYSAVFLPGFTPE